MTNAKDYSRADALVAAAGERAASVIEAEASLTGAITAPSGPASRPIWLAAAA